MYTKLFGLVSDTDISDRFSNHTTKLLNLDRDKVKKITNHVDAKKEGFDIPDELITKIAEELQIEPEDLDDILGISKFIYKKVEQRKVTEEQLEQDLETIAQHYGIKLSPENRKEFIKLLFERKSEYELSKKVGTYKVGIIPSVEGIATACDVRAIFDSETSQIASYLPVVIARISTIDDRETEKSVILQFSEKSLMSFKKYLDEAVEELIKMKKELKDRNINIYEENKE